MDIMKMLDDINPSPKTMKYIIVILCSVIVGLFSFDKLTKKDNTEYTEKIQILENKISKLIEKQNILYSDIENINTKTANNFNTIKNYVDSRIEFVILNQNNKNKELVLSLLKLNSNLNFEKTETIKANYESEKYVTETPVEVENTSCDEKENLVDTNNNIEKLEMKSDSIKVDIEKSNIDTNVNSYKPNTIDVKNDTSKKKGFFSRIFKKTK